MLSSSNYLLNLKKAIEGFFRGIIGMLYALVGLKYKKVEDFKSENNYISIHFLVSTILGLAFIILYGYGAANLSYCYNKSLGRGDAESLLWAVAAYFFSGLYYPYYSIVLNPTCNVTKAGGRR